MADPSTPNPKRPGDFLAKLFPSDSDAPQAASPDGGAVPQASADANSSSGASAAAPQAGTSPRSFVADLFSPKRTGASEAGGAQTPPRQPPPPKRPGAATGPAPKPEGPSNISVKASGVRRAALIGDRCGWCNAEVSLPEIAIVCQNCYRFFLRLSLWHGVVAIAAILAAIVLHVRTGHSSIPLVVGLVGAELLLLATVRLLERRVILFLLSLALVPFSVAIVANIQHFEGDLPRFLPMTLPWLIVLLFAGLAVQLFMQWWMIGRARNLSVWRILSTFSVLFSLLALILSIIIGLFPDEVVPQRSMWLSVKHVLQFRIALLGAWFGYVVLLAMPPAFARPVSLPATQSTSVFAALHKGIALLALKLGNLARELWSGALEIIEIGRLALKVVGRSLLFLVSSLALQVACCLCIENYLSYMDTRAFNILQLVVAGVLLVTMLAALFWSATAAAFYKVLDAAVHTLAVAGLVVLLLAAISSWIWSAYEVWSNRMVARNWFAVLTLGTLLLSTIITVARGYGRDGNNQI